MKYSKRQDSKRLTLTAMMTVVICICSFISIPFVVPFTMQIFAVCISVLLLGGTYGTLSIALYLLMGIIGLPVFSGFTGGIGHLLGPTGGYIIGFLFIGIVYMLFENMMESKPVMKTIALFTGLILCYLIGTIWFMYVTNQSGITKFLYVAMMCVVPYIIPDLLKIVLALYVCNKVKRFI